MGNLLLKMTVSRLLHLGENACTDDFSRHPATAKVVGTSPLHFKFFKFHGNSFYSYNFSVNPFRAHESPHTATQKTSSERRTRQRSNTGNDARKIGQFQ